MDENNSLSTLKDDPNIIDTVPITSHEAAPSSGLNKASDYLIKIFEEERKVNRERGIAVNPIASEVAAWYEKIRTAIENRDEEVILRAAIERIIRRRMLLGGNGKTVSAPLVRELIWARYFPDESIGEDKILEIEETIDRYLELRNAVLTRRAVKEAEMNEWTYQLMSSDIEDRLNPTIKKEAMINYIFHNVHKMVTIKDDTQETRDVQVFIAIRKSYAKEDLAFLRYNLFNQFFGRLSPDNINETITRFGEGKKIIDDQLKYRGRFKIFEFVKRQIPPFLIMEDIMRKNHGKVREIVNNKEELNTKIEDTCQLRYSAISTKVRRAIVRSIIFIFLTKVFLALTIEGTYDRLVFGHILWHVIAINISVPVTIMIIMSFFIKPPGKDNTERIKLRVDSLLFDETPMLGKALIFSHKPKAQTLFDTIFSIVWFSTYLMSFGIIIYILTRLEFSFVSQGFFIFFFAIICFLSYRINQMASQFTVKDKPRLITPFIDFFFMPIARVGRYLAEGVSQVNVFVFLLDLVIETPLKGLISFFELWFSYMHQKREDLAQ
ncbi:MAG TPA: hypothetical protein VG917_01020 [Patescibacteria group bacterium]|nr:hypothetical protein [Patescibacteria group bacterium]